MISQLPLMRKSCLNQAALLQNQRPDEVVEHQAGPDQTTCVEVNMAAATDATNPTALKPRSGEAAFWVRFAAKVDCSPGLGPSGDCHLWGGRVDGRGYGEIKIGGRYFKAHRLALFGLDDIRNPLFACHRCDNPRCVNPAHLFPGTSVDNVSDMIAKGRRRAHQPKRGRSAIKLSAEDVREIRATQISGREGARKYGCSRFTIMQVRRGLLYKAVI